MRPWLGCCPAMALPKVLLPVPLLPPMTQCDPWAYDQVSPSNTALLPYRTDSWSICAKTLGIAKRSIPLEFLDFCFMADNEINIVVSVIHALLLRMLDF